jgi:hypothetical protein
MRNDKEVLIKLNRNIWIHVLWTVYFLRAGNSLYDRGHIDKLQVVQIQIFISCSLCVMCT